MSLTHDTATTPRHKKTKCSANVYYYKKRFLVS